MYRGCRRLVCSLACVFCILFMLFLDTCTVNASSATAYNSITSACEWFVNKTTTGISSSVSVYPSSGTYDLEYLTSNGSFTDSGTISTVSGVPSSYRGSGSFTLSNTTSTGGTKYYTYHVSIPVRLYFDTSNWMYLDRTYATIVYLTNFSSSSYVSNVYLSAKDNTVLAVPNTDNGSIYYVSGKDMLAVDGQTFGYSAYLNYDISFASTYLTSSSSVDPITASVSYNTICGVGLLRESETTIKVEDTPTKEELESLNETTTDTNETTHSIFDSISSFFGSFFENLIGIFVPEDGYFSGWFDRVNTLLSDKLGMLYAPFDLVISTLQAIYSADSTESGIPFPGIKWEDTWLVEPFTFTFASLGDSFDDLRDKVYFATDTVLVLTFLMLLQSKVKLILEGHE